VLRILVGNKCDLEGKRAITYEQGKDLAKQYNVQFLETSPKHTVNIDELFINTTKVFLERQTAGNVKRDVKKDRIVKNGISVEKINENPKKKNEKCC
jgi:GTPase SAR1 family protein